MNAKKTIKNILAHIGIYRSLKVKLILLITMVLLIFIAASFLNNIIMSYVIREKISQSITGNINQTDKYISFIFKGAQEVAGELASTLYEEDYIRRLLNEDINNINEYDQYKAIDGIINKTAHVNNTNSYINSIYVYCSNLGKLITSRFSVYKFENAENNIWEKHAKNDNYFYAFKWLGLNSDSNLGFSQGAAEEINLITLFCRADILTMKKIKSPTVIGINYEERTIYNIIKELKLTPNTNVYLVDENNKIISACDKSQIGIDIIELFGIEDFLDKDSFFREKIKNNDKSQNGKYYDFACKINPITNWRIILSIPENEIMKENTMMLYTISLAFILLTILLIYLISRIVIEYVDKPMAKLVNSMKLAETGNFDAIINEQREDEFGQLYKSYNSMILKIKTLIKELYQEKIIKNNLQLKYLHNQINPHFLYNTLDTINWLAAMGDIENISTITQGLSNLYRTAFNKGMDYIEVEKCIKSLEYYLFIQKFRYGDKLKYSIAIDENVKGFLILNLILQPIVENTIVHGLKGKNSDIEVNISACLKDNAICFTVMDNGIGMTEENLEILKFMINHESEEYDSGLRNVHRRIKLYYGEQYGITIKSKYKEGTIVEILVPVFEYAGS